MAEQELNEDAKRRLEAGRQAKEKSLEEFAKKMQGKPTPTQAENDEAAHGKHFLEHEADGGEPDPSGQVERTMEGGRGGSYQTRQSRPAAAPPRTPTS
jgi:hypothetical protein